MTLVIDAEPLAETEFGLESDGVDLGELGTVIELNE